MGSSGSGSGKSTLARNITSRYPTFTRFSIDKTLLETRGTTPWNYSPSKYEEYQEEAELVLKTDLKVLLNKGQNNAVLDMSFYSKEFRDEYRKIVEIEGNGRYQILLVVFKGDEETLWERIENRRREHVIAEMEGRGREGVSVDRQTLRMYLSGFEWPDGEGELVVKV